MKWMFSGIYNDRLAVCFHSFCWMCFLSCSTVVGQSVTLTMDDLGNQPVDGLMHPSGVEFEFTVNGLSSTDANYGAGGPGTTMYVDDPSIEGTTAGVLRIDFPQPTPVVEFGIAISDGDMLTNAVNVELQSEAGVPLYSEGLDFNVVTMFTESHFVYSGLPVSTAIVDFTPAGAATDPLFPRFAFDNLTFEVPEPTSLAIASGVLLCAVGHRPRHAR